MTHKFVINDDSNVNDYGYRVMTAGIDSQQFMKNPVVLYIHSRGFNKRNGPEGNEVIGRVINLERSGTQLMAEVEFDVEDEFAKRIAGKIERGYIRMSSLGAEAVETSNAVEDVLPGQVFETVTKSKLIELSIVDIGANERALKLSQNGKRIKLNRLKTEINMNIKTIALALNMPEDTKEATVLEKVQTLQLAKTNAEKRVQELEDAQEATHAQEATTLVDKAIQLGLIPEGLKASQVKSFSQDFEAQKIVLSKLIDDKEQANAKDGKTQTVKTVVLGKGSKPNTDMELSYDYLQKKDPAKLREIRDNEPKKYAELAKGYASGIRDKK